MAEPERYAVIAQILAGLALVGCAGVLFYARRETSRLRRELTEVSDAASQKNEDLLAEITKLKGRLEEVEGRKTSLWDWTPEPASINLNRRGQVLRLHRRGDSPSEIASTLGLSQGEVMLIVKVHELSRTRQDSENSLDSL